MYGGASKQAGAAARQAGAAAARQAAKAQAKAKAAAASAGARAEAGAAVTAYSAAVTAYLAAVIACSESGNVEAKAEEAAVEAENARRITEASASTLVKGGHLRIAALIRSAARAEEAAAKRAGSPTGVDFFPPKAGAQSVGHEGEGLSSEDKAAFADIKANQL